MYNVHTKGLIDRSALVQVMDWHLVGGKPFCEPMMTQFTDIYASPGLNMLTHWPLGNLNEILVMEFENRF